MPTTDDLWRFVWEALAVAGACDEWGSSEQARITSNWIVEGRPVGIAEYIIASANTGPASVPVV